MAELVDPYFLAISNQAFFISLKLVITDDSIALEILNERHDHSVATLSRGKVRDEMNRFRGIICATPHEAGCAHKETGMATSLKDFGAPHFLLQGTERGEISKGHCFVSQDKRCLNLVQSAYLKSRSSTLAGKPARSLSDISARVAGSIGSICWEDPTFAGLGGSRWARSILACRSAAVTPCG